MLTDFFLGGSILLRGSSFNAAATAEPHVYAREGESGRRALFPYVCYVVLCVARPAGPILGSHDRLSFFWGGDEKGEEGGYDST